MRAKQFYLPSDSESVRNRNTRKAPQANILRRYQEESSEYVTDSFTNECYKQIKSISKNAVAQSPGLADFDLQKILISISKKLLMNELEFLFMGCLLDELKWQYTDPTIKNFAMTLKPLVPKFTPDDINYRCIELYLLLSAYSVKVYLNEDNKMFENDLNEMLPKFFQIFQTWANRFAMSALSANPKKLNKKYVETTISQSEIEHEDLNKKVAELVQTNPATEVREAREEREAREAREERAPPPKCKQPQQQDQLQNQPRLNVRNSRGGSVISVLQADMLCSVWSRESYAQLPMMRQPSQILNSIPGFGRLMSNEPDLR